MFKVGDKGKTRDGRDYEISDLENGYFVVTVDDSPSWRYNFDGTAPGLDYDWHLVPPESHEEVEMPECPCEDEYSFATLAESAAQIARDHPDLVVQITLGSSSITIFAA